MRHDDYRFSVGLFPMEVRSNGHDEGTRAGVTAGSAYSNRSGTNGHGGIGLGATGHESNGRRAPGRPEVPAADRGPDLELEPADRRARGEPAAGRTSTGRSSSAGGRVAVPEQARALHVPATTSDSSSPAIGIPVARAESTDGERSGHDASTPARRPPARSGDALAPGTDRPEGCASAGGDRRRPERPPIGPAVVAALPVPRTTEAVLPSASAPRFPGSRELRRRVPQSHLAPELRHPSTGLADTAAPLSADAAASALSRYQASRLAAQAVVGDPDVDHQGREGERE